MLFNSLVETVFFFFSLVLEVEAELGGIEGGVAGSGVVGKTGDEVGSVVRIDENCFCLFTTFRNDVLGRFATLLSLIKNDVFKF